jgi:hypothetical protein
MHKNASGGKTARVLNFSFWSFSSSAGQRPFLLFSWEDAVGERNSSIPQMMIQKKTRKIPSPPIKQIIRVHCQTGLPAESSHIVFF